MNIPLSPTERNALIALRFMREERDEARRECCRWMAQAMGCTHIFLDHLSIVVSGLADGDERRIIDNTMTKLRSLVEETGVACHLDYSKETGRLTQSLRPDPFETGDDNDD